MSTEPTAGLQSRTEAEEPYENQPDDGRCIVCGDPADGIDAPTRSPICGGCANRAPSADERVLTDGGVVAYDCPECGEISECDVDDAGQRRCSDCGRAVTALVADGGRDVRPGRRRVTSTVNFGGTTTNQVATPGDDVNHLSGEVSVEVSGASSDYPHPTRLQREIEAAVLDVLENYDEKVADGVETDGGTTVTEHLHVVIDGEGLPLRAYRDLHLAQNDVEDDGYSRTDSVEVVPDVPVLERSEEVQER